MRVLVLEEASQYRTFIQKTTHEGQLKSSRASRRNDYLPLKARCVTGFQL